MLEYKATSKNPIWVFGGCLKRSMIFVPSLPVRYGEKRPGEA